MRSVAARVFVKMRVVLCSCTNPSISSYNAFLNSSCLHATRSFTGLKTCKSSCLMNCTSMIRQSLPTPTRNSATSSSGATVALRPTLHIWADRYANRSKLKLKCTPRLFSASACTSSTMHHSTFCRCAENFCEHSMIARLSGVVIKICGAFFSMSAFSFAVVSPVLVAIRIPNFLPAISSICRIGSIRFIRISSLRALSGLIYTQYTLSSSIPCSCRSIRLLRILRNPVNVFVAPVGALTRTFFLEWISRTPYFCGRENSLKREKNHCLTTG